MRKIELSNPNKKKQITTKNGALLLDRAAINAKKEYLVRRVNTSQETSSLILALKNFRYKIKRNFSKRIYFYFTIFNINRHLQNT